MNERDLFIAARKLESVEQRRTFLAKACGADAQLHARVSDLLQAEEQAGSFLQQPALPFAPSADCVADGTAQTELDGDPADGEPTTVSLDFLAPSRLPGSLGCMGQYEITECVGSGGMGIVLKAGDPRLNRVVAVKVLAPELASNATARRRFVREGQAAAAIAHPHIVTIFAVDEDRLPYLVMEYVDGVSLQEKIDRDGHLDLKETLRIGAQIAAGLSAAHAQGVIHRDIKPANILLENGVERVRITDFGLARAVDDAAVTRAGEVAGTPQYMSPEQAQGQPVDARSDLFSLGCVLYAMCTGRSPFRAETSVAALRRVCDDTPRPIQDVNPETPDWLSAIITRLLEKLPENRIQAAAEVADLLNQHLAHLQNPAIAPASPVITARRRRTTAGARRRWLIAALVLTVATVGLGATEAVGVTQFAATIVRIVTGEGTLVIEVDDPEIQVSLDGEELSITGAGLQEVRLRPGQYQFRAMKGGTPLRQELVTITRGDRAIVRVSREAPERSAVPPTTTPVTWGEWVPLFNGTDLSGWITHPRQPDGWRVEDGAIVGSGPVSHLFTERGDYRDFELRAEVQITRSGNSGIYFRSPLDLVFRDGRYPPAFEIQIYNNDGPSGRDPYKTGSLHDKLLYRDVIVPGEDWFTLEIRVTGNQLVAAVNGVTTANTVLLPDPWRRAERGHFALQTTGGTVRFRKIEIREPRAAATANSADDAQDRAPAWTGWPADAPPPAIAPFDAARAAAHQEAWASKLGTPVEYTNSIGMKLRLIPPGEFMMGTPPEDAARIHASAAGWAHDHERSIVLTESPPHRVCLTQPFFLGAHEVTRGEFQKFVEATGYKTIPERTGLGGWAHCKGRWARRPEQVWSTPGEWQPRDDEPVCMVTWSDAVAFCEWLSEVEKRRYVLPTEAQWEFACRAGTSTATYASPDESLAAIAWTNELVMTSHPQPVGQKRPNAFGLHDMLGNVWEHCADWYSPGSADGRLQIDPAGPEEAQHRVLRGGAWYRSGSLFARSAARNDFADTSGGSDAGIGFRVAIGGDLRTAVPASRQMESGALQPLRTFHHGSVILAAAVAPDDASIVSAGEDHTLRLWNIDTGELIRTFTGHSAPIISVAFSNDGRRILSSGWGDTTTRLWDVATGQELKRFGHDDAVLGAALSPDGVRVATSDHKPTLRLWNVQSGEELRQFDVIGLPKVRVIAFSPDGRTLLTGSLDGSSKSVLRLWNVETGEQLRPFAGHTDWITSVAFSADGQRALSSSWDRTVRLWDVASSTELRCLTHTDKVESAALSPDGRQVLSGKHDGTISLWDVESGNEISRIAAHTAGVWIVAFLSDQPRAISASQDGTVQLWNLADGPPPSAATAPEP